MDLLRRRKKTIVVVCSLLLLLFVVQTVRSGRNLRRVKQLRDEIAQAPTPEVRATKSQELREVSAKLSPSERQQLADEGMKRFEDQLRKYHAMSPAEKNNYLDEQLNRMDRMRANNPGGPRPGGPGGPGQGFGPGNAPPGANGPPGGPGGGAPASTPAEREKRRREMLNKSTPEFRALMDEFRRDMERRRQQRQNVKR